MSFSVSAWNVEFFGSKRKGDNRQAVTNRVKRVFAYLEEQIKTDVYVIFEANGAQVFQQARARFPSYTWRITEGSGSQDILVGSRLPVFITERTEFAKGFKGPLRPGTLVTLDDAGIDYSMLFLHLKAADSPIDFGVRVHQHEKARSLRKALDKAAPGGRANFIVAGDFNGVGMNLTFAKSDIELEEELERLSTMYGSARDGMPIREKTHDVTFWNGPGSSDPQSNIDHVAAAGQIQFKQVGGADIEVKGWPEETTPAKQGKWIRDFSDHALLRFRVTGVQ